MNTQRFSNSSSSSNSKKAQLTLNAAALTAAAAGGASVMYIVLPHSEPNLDDVPVKEEETGEESTITTEEDLNETKSADQSTDQTDITSQTDNGNTQQHNPPTPNDPGTSEVDTEAVAMQIAQSVEIDPEDSANPTEIVFDRMGMVFTPDGESHNAIWTHTHDGQELVFVDLYNIDEFNFIINSSGEYVAQSRVTFHASDFQIYTNPDGGYMAYNPSINPADPAENDVIRTDGKEEQHHDPNETPHPDAPTEPEIDFNELLNELLGINTSEDDSPTPVEPDNDEEFAYIDDAHDSYYSDDDDVDLA